MTDQVITIQNNAELAATVVKAKAFKDAARAENTKRSYGSDWADFSAWCAARGFDPLPARPTTVILYVTDLADRYKVSTITRRLSAISQAHRIAGHESPTRNAQVHEVMKGLKRQKGTAREKRTAILVRDIQAIVNRLPDNLLGIRDRALLLVGFAGGFRRSELAALDVEDVEFTDDGLVVTVQRSKTDQEARGEKVGITYGSNLPTCPVRSLKAWIEASGITNGALFRSLDRHGRMHGRLSAKAVTQIIKRRAKAAGLDPTRYAAHSLRSGMATQADLNGVSLTDIKRQGRWRDDKTVHGYMQRTHLFQSNASAKLGL